MAKFLLYVILLAAVGFGVKTFWDNNKDSLFGKFTKDAAGGQLIKGQEVIDKAKGLVSSGAAEAVQQVVNAYKSETGNFPASLQDLLNSGKLTDIPAGITYDPSTGKVSAN
jgi:hypothetical protein